MCVFWLLQWHLGLACQILSYLRSLLELMIAHRWRSLTHWHLSYRLVQLYSSQYFRFWGYLHPLTCYWANPGFIELAPYHLPFIRRWSSYMRTESLPYSLMEIFLHSLSQFYKSTIVRMTYFLLVSHLIRFILWLLRSLTKIMYLCLLIAIVAPLFWVWWETCFIFLVWDWDNNNMASVSL